MKVSIFFINNPLRDLWADSFKDFQRLSKTFGLWLDSENFSWNVNDICKVTIIRLLEKSH